MENTYEILPRGRDLGDDKVSSPEFSTVPGYPGPKYLASMKCDSYPSRVFASRAILARTRVMGKRVTPLL